jgi:uncharacterized C2H2 Zn-finger protein
MYCPRCWQIFQNEADVDSHLQRKQVCEIGEAKSIERLDKTMEVRLRSRKRTTLSEVEKWKEVYRILFPDDSDDMMPSPCKNFSARKS